MLECRLFQSDPEKFACARFLREAVFVREQGFPPELEFDREDEEAVHVVAYLDGRPVGTGRLLFRRQDPPGFLYIGRLCVLREHRGKGVGRKIMERLMERARAQGAAGALIVAQVPAMAFYEELGFCQQGKIFYTGTVPHVEMLCRFG